MKDIVFIGSGAVASEVISYLKEMSSQNSEWEFKVKGFLDDSKENFTANAEKYKFEAPYLGLISEHSFSKENDYIFGLSSPDVKEKILNKIDVFSINFPNIVHPSVIISDTSVLGKGNVIYPQCIVGPNVTIGNFNLFTSYSFISHDCTVGNNNFFSTSGLSGNVKVGNNNFFGIRTTVIPKISIGSSNLIQAGMTIDKDVTDNETVFYRFKEKLTIIK